VGARKQGDAVVFRQRMVVDGADVDELGHASNVAYLRWIQDVAKAHSEHVGWAYRQYLELGAAFVVRRHEVDYLRPVYAGEELELDTWIEGWSAATSVRRTSLRRVRDQLEVARSSTTWALVSLQDGRPRRIPAELRTSFAEPPAEAAARTAKRATKRQSPTAPSSTTRSPTARAHARALRGKMRRRGASRERASAAKPFLKWAGGKRSLVAQFEPYLPQSFGRLYEPFVGGGALFFHLGPKRATLADTNARLARAYMGLRDDPDGVIELLSSYPHDKAFYLRMRQRPIDDASDAEVAAWFIYLNKTGYNGLYRVNSKNRFNVPFGDYKRPTICDETNLRACAARLRSTNIRVADFEKTASRARSGDLVYFDPPYVPLSVTSSFTSYTADGFGMDEQRRLCALAQRLKKRGVHVLVSNSSAPAVAEMYADFEQIPIRARRSINSRTDRRGEVTELLMR
jgi:DNA adenine methylase